MRQGQLVFNFAICGLVLLFAASVLAQRPDPQAAWENLTKPPFDRQKVATVNNVTLKRDLIEITLLEGKIGFGQAVAGRTFAAAFKGRGRLYYKPQLPLEIQQIQFHVGQPVVDLEFTEAVFTFADRTFEQISEQVEFTSGNVSDLEALYRDRNEKLVHYGLNWEPRLLRAWYSSFPEFYGFFHAELKTRDHGHLWVEVDNKALEEISLTQFDESRYAFNTWSSFPAGGLQPQEVYQFPAAKHELEVTHYKLDITVEKDTTLRGLAQVTVEPKIPLQILDFSLDANLRVEEVTTESGTSLLFFQPRDPKGRFTQFGNRLTVVLPQPLSAGEPADFLFRYAGKHVVEKVGRNNFFCQSYGWYPTTGGDFIYRIPFDITLQVPEKYTAVAVGNKVEEVKEGDYRITRWVTDVPVAVAGFAFGSFRVKTHEVDDVTVEVYANRSTDDFWNVQFSVYVDPSGTGGVNPGAIGIDPTIAPEELGTDAASMMTGLHSSVMAPARMAKTMAVEMGNSLRVFEKYFGPYPYKTLAVTNIPWTYGQGWPGLIYLSALSFIDSTQRHQLGIRGDHKELTDRWRAHETSHQWWGHVVGWKSYHDQWLSEGFAEYSGMLYSLFRRGPEDFLRALRSGRDQLLAKDRYGAVYDEIGPIYAGRRLSTGQHPFAYQTIVYTKGAWVLHMLRMMMFDPRAENPDERFIAMMKDFTSTYYNQAASTEDFKQIAEKYMTPTMNIQGDGKLDWFFDQWVYETGIPHYEISYSITPTTLQNGQAGALLKGTVKQSRVPPEFMQPVPFYVHQGDKSMRLGFLAVRGEQTPFEVELPFQIDKVTIDQWEDVLCTVDYKTN